MAQKCASTSAFLLTSNTKKDVTQPIRFPFQFHELGAKKDTSQFQTHFEITCSCFVFSEVARR